MQTRVVLISGEARVGSTASDVIDSCRLVAPRILGEGGRLRRPAPRANRCDDANQNVARGALARMIVIVDAGSGT